MVEFGPRVRSYVESFETWELQEEDPDDLAFECVETLGLLELVQDRFELMDLAKGVQLIIASCRGT